MCVRDSVFLWVDAFCDLLAPHHLPTCWVLFFGVSGHCVGSLGPLPWLRPLVSLAVCCGRLARGGGFDTPGVPVLFYRGCCACGFLLLGGVVRRVRTAELNKQSLFVSMSTDHHFEILQLSSSCVSSASVSSRVAKLSRWTARVAPRVPAATAPAATPTPRLPLVHRPHPRWHLCCCHLLRRSQLVAALWSLRVQRIWATAESMALSSYSSSSSSHIQPTTRGYTRQAP